MLEYKNGMDGIKICKISRRWRKQEYERYQEGNKGRVVEIKRGRWIYQALRASKEWGELHTYSFYARFRT